MIEFIDIVEIYDNIEICMGESNISQQQDQRFTNTVVIEENSTVDEVFLATT